MANLFHKDEPVQASPAVVGYRIMQVFEKHDTNAISFFDLVEEYRNEPWFSGKKLHFGLMFLYIAGLIDFNAPYVEKHVPAHQTLF